MIDLKFQRKMEDYEMFEKMPMNRTESYNFVGMKAIHLVLFIVLDIVFVVLGETWLRGLW